MTANADVRRRPPRPWQSRQFKLLASRAGLNVADQVVSSGTNLVLSLLVAHFLSQEGFGAFSIAFTVYSLLVSTGRAVLSAPLQVRFTSSAREQYRVAARAAAGGSVLLGLAALVVCVVTGLVIGGTTGASLVTIGIFLPGLLLQDMWRAIFIGDGRPGAALINDCLWGVVQFSAVAVFVVVGQRTATAMEIGWAGAASIAALVGILQFKARPLVRAALPWLHEQRDLLRYYVPSFISTVASGYLTILVIGAVGGADDVGAIRAAQVVMGPLNLAVYSLQAFAVPEVARRQLKGRSAILAGVAISGAMVLVALVGGGALLLLPDDIGRQLLGSSWAQAQRVLPATIFSAVIGNAGFGAVVVLTARGFARDGFWITAPLLPGYLVFGLLGLHLDGARGAVFGMALCQCVIEPIAWFRLVQLLRREAAVPETTVTAPAS